MGAEEVVSTKDVYFLVPIALAYGGYNAWRLYSKNPMHLCGVLRYLLGYWVGSTLYILIFIAFPILLGLAMLIAYYLLYVR